MNSDCSAVNKMSLENFSKLDTVLRDVHKRIIKIDKDERQRAYKIFDQMRKVVMTKLKESGSLINVLKCGNTDGGSFFRGVKVGKPDEFDIDIQLKLPFDYDQIKITLTEPGYIKINIKKAYESNMKIPTWADKYAGLNKFIDQHGFLVGSKILTEIESIFTRQFGVGYFPLEFNDGIKAKVRIKKNGPAFTFEVNVDDLKIDIDFVYVIYFDPNLWPPEPVKKFKYTLPNTVNNYWLAVPKPTENPLSWRLSFPHQECFFLDRNDHLKLIYRLLKALRDVDNWNLASYHIATLLLWKSEQEIEINPAFWKQSLGTLFMLMLAELKSAMENHTIQFFWDDRCNMIEDLKPATTNNIANRISKIQQQIRVKYTDDPALSTYILSKVYRIKDDNVIGELDMATPKVNNKVVNVKDSTLITMKSTNLIVSSIINSVQSTPKSKSSKEETTSAKRTTQNSSSSINNVKKDAYNSSCMIS